MPRAIGIDIGTGNLKICEVDGTARKFRVTKYIEAEFDQGVTLDQTAEEIADVLRELFKQHKLKGDQITASLSSQHCVMRKIVVPFVGDEQIRKVIRFEAESHLHSHSLEDVVVCHHKTGERESRSEVLIFAGLKEKLRRDLEIYDEAGIDPMQIDLESAALYNAVRTAGLLDPDQVQVILEFGAEKTNLVITDGEEIDLVRSIRIATDTDPHGQPGAAAAEGEGEAVAEPQGDWVVVEDEDVVEPDASPQAADESGDAEAADVAVSEVSSGPVTPHEHREFPFLRRVLVEVQRSLVRCGSDKPLGKVLITGGGSLIEGLPPALEDGLQVPVEWVDLREVVSHDLDEQEIDNLSSFGTIALGLALKPLGGDHLGLDFRQDDLRYQKAFDQVKVVMSCCVSLVAILLLVILAYFNERKFEAREPWNVMVDEARIITEDVLGPLDDVTLESDAVTGMIGSVQVKNRAFRKKFGGGGEYPPLRSAFDVWNELFRAIHLEMPGLRGLKLDTITIDQNGIVLKGTLADASQLDVLQAALKKSSPLFEEIDTGGYKNVKGIPTFTNFRIRLPEPENS